MIKKLLTIALSATIASSGFVGSIAYAATAPREAVFFAANAQPGAPGAGVLSHVPAAGEAAAAATFTGSGYYYAAAQQTIDPAVNTVKGMSATLEVTQPYVQTRTAPATSDHSLFEIILQDASGNAVEFGWAAEPTFGDTKPRLFASRFTGGTWGGCYGEGCGWIDKTPADSTDDLGIDLTSVATATWPANAKTFKMVYESPTTCGPNVNAGNWDFYYAGTLIGCYPPTAVPSFSASTAQGFSEVWYAGTTVPCTDAGNGKKGSAYNGAPIDATDPAYIGSLAFYGPSIPAYGFNLVSTDSNAYDAYSIGSTGNRTFTLGGPGYNSTSGTPGNIGSC